ncbi:MAG: RCC1 domain-containing protein [Candidatus Omnitrophica bacterium]|nr:RCC1 domain-containing protein [Candidatus Omnitrophota bacterium]
MNIIYILLFSIFNRFKGLVVSTLYLLGQSIGWGYNNYGQLGDNSRTNRSVPTSVSYNYSTSCKSVRAGADSAVVGGGAGGTGGNGGKAGGSVIINARYLNNNRTIHADGGSGAKGGNGGPGQTYVYTIKTTAYGETGGGAAGDGPAVDQGLRGPGLGTEGQNYQGVRL